MTKASLLDYLDRTDGADAREVASALGEPYSTAAMALLRLSRQGLVARYRDPDTGSYWYQLTERGEARLAYLETNL